YIISWKKSGGALGDAVVRRLTGETVPAGALPGKTAGGSDKALAAPKEKAEATSKQMAVKALSWDDVEPVDRVGLEVGYRLGPLVDAAQGGELLNRMKGVVRKLGQALGFLTPSVRIRDNLEMLPNQCRITLMGVTLAE